MITLFEEIRCCGGKEGCWGKKNPGCRKPVVIPCKRRPNVMIITEQMNIHEKEWRKNIQLYNHQFFPQCFLQRPTKL